VKFVPRPYQVEAARHLAQNRFTALLADPGTGKTAITLAVLRGLKQTMPGHRALVISTPKIIHNVWPEEVAKWDQFNGLTYSLLHGPKKNKALGEKTDFHLMSFAAIPWASKQKIFEGYHTLVVDESTKLKNWTSQRMMILRRYLPSFKRRYILTGTPVPENLDNYFSQQFIVDLGSSFGTSITAFRHEWFIDVAKKAANYSIWKPRNGALDFVLDQIRPYSFRLDGDMLLDLPEVHINDIVEHFDKDLQEKYDELCYDEESAGEEFTFSRQLASGYLSDGRVFHAQKMERLVDLVDSLQGKPIIVCFCFRREGEAIARQFKCPLIYGGTPQAEAGRVIQKWNSGGLPVVAMNPASMGHGINLQEGGYHLAFFSLPSSQDEYIQMICRLKRPGQASKTVFVHRLVMAGTVDTKRLIPLLEKKTEMQEKFLNGALI
jgi:SNF2 family DNA or RNA helicase